MLYLQLSAMMFLQFAVWGAWMPVLAARLLGPLKMSGKQTGWIYATLPLSCMISPLLAGQLADKYVNADIILAVCHGVGCLLLIAAARIKTFTPLFIVMLAYTMLYAATLPLVNSILFRNVQDVGTQAAIFIWAPVAWALVGYILTGWRNLRKAEGDGSDCLKFAAILSILMTVVCLWQPSTPPNKEGKGVMEALSMLHDPKFALFIAVSLVVGGLMQFYFLGTGQYLQDRGISGKNVPAIMGIAQAVQALATFFALGILFTKLGPKMTLILGAASWALIYLIYTIRMPKAFLIGGQVFHGLAYVFFMIAGQMYVSKYVHEIAKQLAIESSAQALIFLVTTGIGLFLGTQLAGFSMDRFATDGKINWSKVFAIPMVLTALGVVALVVGL